MGSSTSWWFSAGTPKWHTSLGNAQAFDENCKSINDLQSMWWSWGDLNPRPQAFFAQFYMCSRLFWVSPDATRSDTLCTQPATLNLTAEQVARPTASLCKFPRSQDSLATTLTQPMGQLLRGSPD